MSEPALVLFEGVGKVYGQDEAKTRALSDIDLTIAKGELVALTGPSGSGKSTLLNLLGLLDRPTAGRILLNGIDTTKMNDAALTDLRAKMLGFVFQFHHLLPAFNAIENVMLPDWGHTGRPSADVRARAEELLRQVGLGQRLDRLTNKLSGGEQQRVAIARALVNRPPLVLADEPTGNLDTESSNAVFALLRQFNRDRGTTFLVVTHDERIAAACDRVIEMVDGRLTKDARRSGA